MQIEGSTLAIGLTELMSTGNLGRAMQWGDGATLTFPVSTGVLLLLARAQILPKSTFYPHAGYQPL